MLTMTDVDGEQVVFTNFHHLNWACYLAVISKCEPQLRLMRTSLFLQVSETTADYQNHHNSSRGAIECLYQFHGNQQLSTKVVDWTTKRTTQSEPQWVQYQICPASYEIEPPLYTLLKGGWHTKGVLVSFSNCSSVCRLTSSGLTCKCRMHAGLSYLASQLLHHLSWEENTRLSTAGIEER